MNGSCLEFGNPIRDAISRIEFAPKSNNLLISSWDSVSVFFAVNFVAGDFECNLVFLLK